MWVCPGCSCWRRRRRAAACRRRVVQERVEVDIVARRRPKSDAAATEAAACITSADAAGVADSGCSAGAGACVGVQRLRAAALRRRQPPARRGSSSTSAAEAERTTAAGKVHEVQAQCTLGVRVVRRRRAFRPPSCRPVHVVASLLSVDRRGRWQLGSPCWGDAAAAAPYLALTKGEPPPSSRPLLPSPSSSIASVRARVGR
ncbi:hypothetical protein BJ912DRAFT_983347, partial [Pholiota molesta]